ncbi:MAG: DNA polymerase III subunit beta [Chloroflexi bacterium]|nr:DNA polymerase III subunit beta [Chloroflexota bacterium]
MRLSCLQQNLARGLSIVGRAVATRTTLPITQNVLIQTDNSRLKLSATNLEIAITTWVGAQVDEEGACTVPARLLTEFINALPPERVDISLSQRPRGLHLRCGRFEAHINGAEAEEFPPIPSVSGGATAVIDAEALHKAVAQVVFAAATDDSRPVLTGVKVEMEGEKFTLAAADGFRLAVHKASSRDGVPEPVSFIVPARTLAELNRVLPDQTDPVEVTIAPSKGQCLFRLRNIELVSQLIQGTFPNYTQLIPQAYASRAVVNLQEFARAVRTASIFARDGSGIIRVHMAPSGQGIGGKLNISSKAEEVGENTAELEASVEGDEARIAFNSRYLTEVLGALNTPEVALEVTSPSSPGVFRPAGAGKKAEGRDGSQPPEEGEYVHVIMPMFVQW